MSGECNSDTKINLTFFLTFLTPTLEGNDSSYVVV